MPPIDEDADAARSRRLYALVLVCEAAVIAALWAFGRVFH
jgi:hypothetical protein